MAAYCTKNTWDMKLLGILYINAKYNTPTINFFIYLNFFPSRYCKRAETYNTGLWAISSLHLILLQIYSALVRKRQFSSSSFVLFQNRAVSYSIGKHLARQMILIFMYINKYDSQCLAAYPQALMKLDNHYRIYVNLVQRFPLIIVLYEVTEFVCLFFCGINTWV